MVKKIAFWVRLAGWSGLISGSSVLMLHQYSHSSLFLINLITIVLFSAYALATANDKSGKILIGFKGNLSSVSVCFDFTDYFLRNWLFY